MNDEEPRKRLATIIGDIIQQFIRDSDELSAALEEARDEGYDVLLTIFSGIVLRRRENQQEDPLPEGFELTEQDKVFLQSIGIAVPEEKE